MTDERQTDGRRTYDQHEGERAVSLFDETVEAVRRADEAAVAAAWERQGDLLKPPGSLGALERLGARLAGSTGQCPPVVDRPAVAVFAADHGVHVHGVTAWPQELTAMMAATVLSGQAVVSAFARQVGAEVRVVDVGMAHPVPGQEESGVVPGLVRRPVRAGTADMVTGPAMTRDEAVQAVEVGIEVAQALIAEGHRLLVTGDLGIGNTTASAALVCAFTGSDPATATGRGAGVDDDGLARKVRAVEQALALHRPDPADPVGVLAAVGGLEHAAVVGLLLGAAAAGVPVVLDGVIACSSALVAAAACPAGVDHWVAGHRSGEPGAQLALDRLGLEPLLDLGLRLGEGTGGLLAVPLVQAAARALAEVGTFSGAGLSSGS